MLRHRRLQHQLQALALALAQHLHRRGQQPRAPEAKTLRVPRRLASSSHFWLLFSSRDRTVMFTGLLDLSSVHDETFLSSALPCCPLLNPSSFHRILCIHAMDSTFTYKLSIPFTVDCTDSHLITTTHILSPFYLPILISCAYAPCICCSQSRSHFLLSES